MKLRGNKHGCDAEQLELVQGDFLLTQISINNVDCDKERFGQQVEFDLNYDEPVDQYFTLLSRYFAIIPQVVASWLKDGLLLSHPHMDLVTVLEVLFLRQQPLILITNAAYQVRLYFRLGLRWETPRTFLLFSAILALDCCCILSQSVL